MSDYQPPELLLLLLLQWHLGSTPGFLPTDHGFDSYFGIPFSVDMGFAYRLPCDDLSCPDHVTTPCSRN